MSINVVENIEYQILIFEVLEKRLFFIPIHFFDQFFSVTI
jgi:hypothetical protein